MNARLDELLEGTGRSPGDVRRTLMTRVVFGRTDAEVKSKLAGQPAGELRAAGVLVGGASEVVEGLDRLSESGVEGIMLQWLETDDFDGPEALAGSVLPQPG